MAKSNPAPETEFVEEAPAPKRDIKAELEAAFAARDEAAQLFVPDPKAVDEAERKLQRLVHDFVMEEKFDPEAEPVLHRLSELAARRSVTAVRLLLQKRIPYELMQNPEGEKQLPPEDIGINGLLCTIPRGIELHLPQSYYEILKQGKVR